jgi:hypothetical protein
MAIWLWYAMFTSLTDALLTISIVCVFIWRILLIRLGYVASDGKTDWRDWRIVKDMYGMHFSCSISAVQSIT